MIDPQVEHGGASSWFWIAAKVDFFGCAAEAEALGLAEAASAGRSRGGDVQNQLFR